MDIEKALQHPSSVFAHPDEVLKDASIDDAWKIKILRRWEYDARELEVAEEENLGGGPPDLLSDILKALDALGAATDSARPDTKQGGSSV